MRRALGFILLIALMAPAAAQDEGQPPDVELTPATEPPRDDHTTHLFYFDALAGLNPHAGEGGMLGVEDGLLIEPVCDLLRSEGMQVTGPLPADTMFHAEARKSYDVAVAMYHDQALIPIKTLAFDRGVNVTLGLPFVRTSPDHGVAFDIAGTGRADPSSLIAALALADDMARRRAASRAAVA